MILTKRWDVHGTPEENKQAINEAAALIKQGLLVAFPTETVYGLGADATNEAAVEKIFQAKGRPQDNPLIAHVATKDQLMSLVKDIPPYVDKLIDKFSPGPITYVLPSNDICAQNVTAGLATVAVRMPAHPVAQALLLACDIPIAAPSANTSGRPSPTQADHVWEDLFGKINGVLDGGATGVGMESTVIECTSDIPVILRPGGITKEQLQRVVPNVEVTPGLMDKQDRPASPGMKYKHYSPEVPLWLINGTPEALQKVVDEQRKKDVSVGVMGRNVLTDHVKADHFFSLGNDLNEVATSLYHGLRSFKKEEVDLIICETFPKDGIGEAIMNRLEKAATEIKNGTD